MSVSMMKEHVCMCTRDTTLPEEISLTSRLVRWAVVIVVLLRSVHTIAEKGCYSICLRHDT